MAGFAVFITIISWVLVGTIGAVFLSICLYVYTKRNLRKSTRTAIESAAAPFLGLAWLTVALLIHLQVSNRLAHQDCGLSGDPYVTLPNGYVLGSLNTYDGYFKAPGFETDVPATGPGYVRSIVDLKYSDGYFRGTQLELTTSTMRNFVFDTRTREFHAAAGNPEPADKKPTTGTVDIDKWADAQKHVHQDPDSYWKLYTQYRHHWPNYFLAALILLGEATVIFGVRRLWRQDVHAGSY